MWKNITKKEGKCESELGYRFDYKTKLKKMFLKCSEKKWWKEGLKGIQMSKRTLFKGISVCLHRSQVFVSMKHAMRAHVPTHTSGLGRPMSTHTQQSWIRSEQQHHSKASTWKRKWSFVVVFIRFPGT